MKHEEFIDWLRTVYKLAKDPDHKHPANSTEGNRNVEAILPEEVAVQSGEKKWRANKGSAVTFYRIPSKHGLSVICTIFDYEGRKQINVNSKKVVIREVVGKPQPQTVPKGAFL